MLNLVFKLNTCNNFLPRNNIKYFSTTSVSTAPVVLRKVQKKKALPNVKVKKSPVSMKIVKTMNPIKNKTNNTYLKPISLSLGSVVMGTRTFKGLPRFNHNYWVYYYPKGTPLLFRFYRFAYSRWIRVYMYRLLKKYFKKKVRRPLKRLNKKFSRCFRHNQRFQFFINRATNSLNLLAVNRGTKMQKQQKQHFKRLFTLKIKRLERKASALRYKKFKEKLQAVNFYYNRKNIVYRHMSHIKFSKTRRTYFNFRYKVNLLSYHRKIKWIYKKRYKRSLKRKVFRSNRTMVYIKKRIPRRKHKYIRLANYKRFSYYWLRYFFTRFKEIYVNTNKFGNDYTKIKYHLLNWLYKVRYVRTFSLHTVNPARGFLVYKSNKLHNEIAPNRLYSSYYKIRHYHRRHAIDWNDRIMFRKKRKLYKGFYWRFFKSKLERRKVNILKRYYQFTKNFAPYISARKKPKVFYNWVDRHIYKKYPLHRYKYNVLFKFPRFADYRRLFKNQLREQHVFRYLYRLKLGQLIKTFRKATYKTKRIFELMFLKYFELRLDTVVYRLNFTWNLKQARQLVARGLYLVNNKVIDNPKYHVSLGDVIMPIKRLRMQPLPKKYLNYVDYGVTLTWQRLFMHPLQSDQYPDHLFINERIPAGMVVNKFNPYKVRHNKPFSVQFLTLSLLKYN